MGAANERDKRWAIAPPPSANSAAMGSGIPTLGVDKEAQEAAWGRRRFSGTELDVTPAESAVNELFDGVEPSDSERVTDVPPGSGPSRVDRELDTIPAPDWADSDEPA